MTFNNNRQSGKRLKILFVSAKPEVDFSTFYIPLNRFWRPVYSRAMRWAMGVRDWEIPAEATAVLANRNLSLEALVNICQDDHDVDIYDEFYGQLTPDDCATYDLVGISIFTATAKRGYELADALRARGQTVILGGSHVNACQEEALAHADALVSGEAENSLPLLLDDFVNGRSLQRIYAGPPPDMTRISGYSVKNALDGTSIPALNLAYSRGCHFKCDFCAISQTQYSFRHRPVAHTLADMDKAIEAGIHYFVIPDALMWGDREAAKELLQGMAQRRINWYGQSSLDVVRNEEFLDLIAESGCITLGLGIESIRPESLKSIRKGQNRVEHYEESIAALHERDVRVNGYFVFGMDGDTLDTFHETALFIERTGIEIPEIYTLIPFPGTGLHKQLDAEGRLLTKDWNAYTRFANIPVFQPKNMSVDDLAAGIRYVEQMIYSKSGIVRRLKNGRRLTDPLSLVINWIMHNRVRHMHGPWKNMRFRDYYERKQAQRKIAA
ncbi:MAG: B12-binding domain-containing radical SAM protein [Chloroflexi bacterium]|nr:B12-binding domain-containing radical SAM protein [Chloroflexota bacterium]